MSAVRVPVAALYEQGKVHHVGRFPELEEQMTEWAPGDETSPDRLDALVWAITYLMDKLVQTGIMLLFMSNGTCGSLYKYDLGRSSGGIGRPPEFRYGYGL